jgi:hypothetical protein
LRQQLNIAFCNKGAAAMEETDVTLRVRAPRELIALADEFALGQNISLSAFTRAALVLALGVEGVATPELKTPRVRKARYYGRPGTRHALAEVTA